MSMFNMLRSVIATSSGATARLFNANDYTGDGNTPRSFSIGVNLNTYGGLVWSKKRNASLTSSLMTGESFTETLQSNENHNYGAITEGLKSLTGGGYTIGNATFWNTSAETYINWIFRNHPDFFNIVTWVGNSVSGREIAHGLNAKPGFVFVKNTSTTGRSFMCQHKDMVSQDDYIRLNLADAKASSAAIWNSTFMDATNVTIGNHLNVNNTGDDYIMYAFANDEGVDGKIVCGTYTGNGAADGVTETLGWQPQAIMIKALNQSGGWIMVDTTRGEGVYTRADLPDAEVSTQLVEFLATGFRAKTNNIHTNTSGQVYVYIAIREE